jgi:hypothetical protein
MYQFLEETGGDLIALRVSGKLDKADYDALLLVIHKAIYDHEQISLYWEMQGFEGWSLGGLWEDGEFGLDNDEYFRRIAVVGEKKWQEWMTAAMKLITMAKVRYFELSEKEAAMAWVEADRESL